jgi:hypothetical protein
VFYALIENPMLVEENTELLVLFSNLASSHLDLC